MPTTARLLLARVRASRGGYIRRHVLRKALLWLERTRPTVLANCTVREMIPWSPDVGGHLAALSPAWTLSEVAHRFGVSAMMLSCWACLSSDIPEDYAARSGRLIGGSA